jgi:hypothetical protein
LKTSLRAELPAQSGIYRHEFVAQAMIGPDGWAVATSTPVISTVLM